METNSHRETSILEPVSTTGSGFPEQPEMDSPDDRLQVTVILTDDQATVAALQHANAMADQLSASIILVVTQIVPYPLPLNSSPVSMDFHEKHISEIAARAGVETAVQVYLCRDRLETLTAFLRPHSLIVIGGRRQWWPTAAGRLAKGLRRVGHEVIFMELQEKESIPL